MRMSVASGKLKKLCEEVKNMTTDEYIEFHNRVKVCRRYVPPHEMSISTGKDVCIGCEYENKCN